MKYFMVDQIKGDEKIKQINGESKILFMGTSFLFSASMLISFCLFHAN